jgi:hypothetical protein
MGYFQRGSNQSDAFEYDTSSSDDDYDNVALQYRNDLAILQKIADELKIKLQQIENKLNQIAADQDSHILQQIENELNQSANALNAIKLELEATLAVPAVPPAVSEENAEPEVVSEENAEPEVVSEENAEPEVANEVEVPAAPNQNPPPSLSA